MWMGGVPHGKELGAWRGKGKGRVKLKVILGITGNWEKENCLSLEDNKILICRKIYKHGKLKIFTEDMKFLLPGCWLNVYWCKSSPGFQAVFSVPRSSLWVLCSEDLPAPLVPAGMAEQEFCVCRAHFQCGDGAAGQRRKIHFYEEWENSSSQLEFGVTNIIHKIPGSQNSLQLWILIREQRETAQMCRRDLGSTTPGKFTFLPHFCRKLRTFSPLQSARAGNVGHFTVSERLLKDKTDLFHPWRKAQQVVGAVVIQIPLFPAQTPGCPPELSKIH